MAERIDQHYRHAQTLAAVFLERYSEGGEPQRAETGRVYFSRPGRMRWDYTSPQAKMFLDDGKQVWFYVPADRTASRTKASESSDWRTPLALLTGKVKLSRLCGRMEAVVAQPSPSHDTSPGGAPDAPSRESRASPASQPSAAAILRCFPREQKPADQPFQSLDIEVNSNYQIVRVLIRQPGDLQTEFRFGNWQENIPIPEVTFHFEPPPGVAIVNESLLAGQIR